MMKKSLLALFFALLGVANAYAEDQTVTVGVKDAGKPMVLPSPKAGENLTVIVEVPVPAKKIAPAATAAPTTLLVVEDERSGVSLRGGVGASYFLDKNGGISAMPDLVGQIGFRQSRWRVRARAGFGAGRYDTWAVAGSLAVMYYILPGTVALGPSLELLGTIDQNSHPRETWKEEFFGGGIRASVEVKGFMLEWTFAAVTVGTSTPGDTPEDFALITGANMSYLWGR